MTERWLPVPEFDGYEVSDLGSVRSWKRNGAAKTRRTEPACISVEVDRDGYHRVRLHRAGRGYHRLVHRLVLEAFVGPCPENCEARHLPNNDPADNRLENLSWAPHLDNIRDKWTHGTMPVGEAHHSRLKPDCIRRGSRCAQARLSESQAREILRSTEPLAVLSDRFGVSVSTVGKVKTGKNWKHVYEEVRNERTKASRLGSALSKSLPESG